MGHGDGFCVLLRLHGHVCELQQLEYSHRSQCASNGSGSVSIAFNESLHIWQRGFFAFFFSPSPSEDMLWNCNVYLGVSSSTPTKIFFKSRPIVSYSIQKWCLRGFLTLFADVHEVAF